MVKYFKTAILLAALVLLGVLLWRHYFPNEEKLIRKMLSGLAQDISIPKKGFANLTAADSIAGYFTPDAEIDVDAPELGHHTINGRQEIVQAALAARTQLPGLRVEFGDTVIKIDASKETATVELTVKVTQTGQRDFEMQDVRMSLLKYNGDWRIAKAKTVKAFK